MARSKFVPNYFKILKLNKKLNLLDLISNIKVPLTFNQLMKSENRIVMVFIFDENTVEIPSLLSYCHFFNIKIFVINDEDRDEIKFAIKHAQMVCIPYDFPYLSNLENTLLENDFEETFCKISIE